MSIKSIMKALSWRRKKESAEAKAEVKSTSVFKANPMEKKKKAKEPQLKLAPGEVITARPEGMPFEEYKILRRMSNERINRRLKRGFLVYKSSEIVEESKDVRGKQRTIKKYRTYQPFVGSVKHDLKVK